MGSVADFINQQQNPNDYTWINGEKVGPSWSIAPSSNTQAPSATASLGNIVTLGRSPIYMPMSSQGRMNAFGQAQSNVQGLPGGGAGLGGYLTVAK